MQAHVSVLISLLFIDAALEMMILMHLASETDQIVHHGPLPSKRVCCARRAVNSLFHLIKPLTSDFLTSSHRDRNTLKQLMFGHCIVLSLSSNLHQVWRQPFTLSCGRRLVCRLSRVWQRNVTGISTTGIKREHTGRPATTYAVVCFLAPPVPFFRHLP